MSAVEAPRRPAKARRAQRLRPNRKATPRLLALERAWRAAVERDA
jgi:hypothetical protein